MATNIFRAVDVFAPIDAAGNARSPVLSEVQAWGVEIEANQTPVTLITSTADLPDSTNRRYVTDAEKAAISGVSFWSGLTYATTAQLTADLAHPAGTVALSLENNGEYVKSGASGSGSWSFLRTHASEQDADRTKYAARRVIPHRPIATLAAGAQFWDGSTTTGATNSSGGFKIPSGQTGVGTNLQSLYTFTTDFCASMAGRKVRFVMTLRTSPDFLAELTDGGTLRLSTVFSENGAGTTGVVENKKFVQQTPTTATYEVDYTFVGDEVQLQHYFSVTAGNVAVSADTYCCIELCDILPMDADGQRDVIEYVTTPFPDNLLTACKRRNSIAYPAYSIKQGLGMAIPIGNNGSGRILRNELPVFNLPVGTEILVTYDYETSANLWDETPITRAGTRFLNNGSTTAISANTTCVEVSPTLTRATIKDTIASNQRGVEISILPNGGTAVNRTSVGKIYLTAVRMEITKAPTGQVAEIIASYRECVQAFLNSRPDYAAEIVTGGPNGTEDYASIKDATDAAGRGAGPQYRKIVLVSPGVYASEVDSENDIRPGEYVQIMGQLEAERQFIDARFPAGTPDQDLIEGMFVDRTADVRNIHIIAENCRYGIHWEAGGVPIGAISNIDDCVIEHLGADGWSSPTAIGIGMHGGQFLNFRRITAVSTTQAVGWHDNINMIQPCTITFEDCHLLGTGEDANALGASCYGSGLISYQFARGCSINGNVAQRTAGWLSTIYQPANRYGFKQVFANCTPFSWYSDTVVDCLECRSIPGATSKVQLSGTAAPVLFGNAPHIVPGGVGYPARAYSQGAISKEGITPEVPVTLAERLGDRSLVSITLGVRFDSAITYNLVLDQDYSASDNPTILAHLNAKLTAAMGGSTGGRAFYVSRPFDDRAPIYEPDREGMALNVSGSAILHRAVLVYDGGGVRPMTASDPVSAMPVVAIGDSLAGGWVRFKRTGQINQRLLSFDGSPSIAAGDTFEIGSTAGALVEGSSRPIFRARTSTAGKAVLEFIGREN
jgi:hypothetical protein